MEGGDQNVGGSRWNPTKEQINMLEGLYKQGLRTPSAEQIQQITARLKDYGQIEGKNVFYWFQNHKARQRQKQKQDTFAYFNRFLHAATTPLFPPYHNVVCSPGFYQQYPKVQLPTTQAGGANCTYNTFKRSKPIPDDHQRYNKSMHGYNTRRTGHHQKTLDLFPIHPTGSLHAKSGIIESGGTESENTENMRWWCCSDDSTPSCSDQNCECSIFGHEKAGEEHHFFDFFCRN